MNRSPIPRHRIRCSSTADFLAALPALTGYWSDHSLFVALFTGKVVSRCMRIDLPDSDDAQTPDEYVEAVVETLQKFVAATGAGDAPAIVISTRETFAATGDAPWRSLARRLERRFTELGLPPRDLACVAPDGWASYRDASTPTGGRPLDEIRESPAALEASVRDPQAPDLDALGALPEADRTRAAQVAKHLAALAEQNLPRPAPLPPERAGRGNLLKSNVEEHPPEWIGATTRTARALLYGRRPLSAAVTATLAFHLTFADRWFALALAVLTRPEFPRELMDEDVGDLLLGMPVDIDAEGAGPELGRSTRRVLDSLSREFEDAPRLPGLIAAVMTAAAETPNAHRSGVYAFIAWLWWLRGSGSVARRHADLAIESDPGNDVSAMIRRLIAVPLIPRYPVDGAASSGAEVHEPRAGEPEPRARAAA